MELSTGYQIIPLFSSPVFSLNLSGQYDVDGLTSAVKAVEWRENHSNSMSETVNWLDSSPIKSLIEDNLNFYFYKVLCASQEIKIYITDSWLNCNKPGEQHHRHNHPNSIVSGVFYIDTDQYTGNIVFNSSHYSNIEIETTESNIYNSKTWSLSPMPGTLILFPSSLEHSVTKNQSVKDRISLSFNTFISGTISRNPLSSLKI